MPKVKYTEACNVSGEDCKSPAGYGIQGFGYSAEDYSKGGGAKFTCYACGLPVCSKCSRLIKYYNYGKQRVCWNCLEELSVLEVKLISEKISGWKIRE